MKWLHSDCLTDEQLRAELEAKDTVVFDGTALNWQEIERQVERLGFGDTYIVSLAKSMEGRHSTINLHPMRAG